MAKLNNAQDEASFPTQKSISIDPTVWMTECTIDPLIFHIEALSILDKLSNCLNAMHNAKY